VASPSRRTPADRHRDEEIHKHRTAVQPRT